MWHAINSLPTHNAFQLAWLESYYNSSSVCLCVCLLLFPPRSFDGSSPNLVGVCRLTSHLSLRGSFSKRSTGRRVNRLLSLSLYIRQPHATSCKRPLLLAAAESNSDLFHYIIYPPASRHTAAKGPFCLLLQSLIRHLLLHCISKVYVRGPRNCPWGVLFLKGEQVNGVCRWTSQLPLRGSFSKRSTGQWVKRVDGSMGHFHYIIYDSRRHHAHATPLQKEHGVRWHQAYATSLQKPHCVFCSLDG